MEVGRISFEPFAYRTVGFDNMLNNIDALLNSTTDKYPPHNIKSLSDTSYVVEIAVAGFKRGDIEITLENGVLTVKAAAKIECEPNVKYLHRGIGTRAFTKILRLADTVVVLGAEMEDGILYIHLENVIPEKQKSKKIEIKSVSPETRQLLNE